MNSIATSITINSDNPLVVAEALREFAGRVERGEIAPGQSGEITERCDQCGEEAIVAWQIGAFEDEDEDDDGGEFEPTEGLLNALFGGEPADGTVYVDTPFGRARVVPLN